MSLWNCPRHGLVGPTACCADAAYATTTNPTDPRAVITWANTDTYEIPTDEDVAEAWCAFNGWGRDMLPSARQSVKFADSRAVCLRRVLVNFVSHRTRSGRATNDKET